MIGNNCGKEINDNALFCENCGAQVIRKQPGSEGTRVSNNITLGQDGKYRWTYEMSLIKNPTIFLLVWKIFFFIIVGIFGFIMILGMVENDDFFPDLFLSDLKILGIFIGGMTALVWISCLIYAMMIGGKYIVEFEMDEHGINHAQTPAQAAKAKKIAKATFLMGAATNDLTTMGIGMNSARTEMYSDFSKVKKVKAYPRWNLIKVNQTLNHNQVYAAPEDFDFVKDFIIDHCTNLK